MRYKLFYKGKLHCLDRTCFMAVSFILFVIASLVNFNGCGVYSFTGASVPAHIKTISIPIADDRSGAGEPNLRESLTQTLIQKFIDDNTLRVTERNNANAVLECTITGFSNAPSVVSERRAKMLLREGSQFQCMLLTEILYRKKIFLKRHLLTTEIIRPG